MNTIAIYKQLLNLFLGSFNFIFIIFILLMILESFLAILTILSIAPFADYLIDNTLSNPSKITLTILELLKNVNLEPNLILFASIFVITNILRSILEILIKYGSLKIKYFLMEKLNLDLINTLMNSKWSYINSLSHGKLLNSIVRETGAIGDCMGIMATQIASIFKLVVLFTMPIYLYPTFMITVFTFCLILFFPFLLFQKIIYKLGKVTTSTANLSVSYLSEIIKNIKLIKAFVRNKYMSDRYKLSMRDHFEVALKSHTLSYALSSLYQPMGIIAIVTTAIFFETILISDFAVIIWSLLQSLPLIGRLLNSNAIIINSYPSFEQVNEIKSRAQLNTEESNIRKIDSIKNIEIKNVSFSYNNSKILNKINMKFKRKDITAIFGVSGSGKSTIIDLLLGFQKPLLGQIIYNKFCLTKLNIETVREKVGFVPQENSFIKGTIKENICFGNFKVNNQKIYKALDLVDANKFVKNKSHGIETEINDGGTNFSGGQKQKLALARSILKNPDFYFLDETTSSLDLLSETKIINNLKELKKKYGIIYITHNIKNLLVADRIYFLENGEITAEGSLKELREKNKNFNKLCEIEGI